MEMYDKFEKGGFDGSVLESYENTLCVIVGLDKFKLLMGNEFTSLFSDLLIKIKAMPKVNFIVLDSVDNIKKSEYDSWYKVVVNSTRGIWIGDGFASQFTLKSTLSSRQLSAKLNNTFGYYVDGSLTVLIKVISDVGEEEDYETL